jgi:hypothetical protein
LGCSVLRIPVSILRFRVDETEVRIEDRDGTLREYVSKETMIGKSVGRWFCSAVESESLLLVAFMNTCWS